MTKTKENDSWTKQIKWLVDRVDPRNPSSVRHSLLAFLWSLPCSLVLQIALKTPSPAAIVTSKVINPFIFLHTTSHFLYSLSSTKLAIWMKNLFPLKSCITRQVQVEKFHRGILCPHREMQQSSLCVQMFYFNMKQCRSIWRSDSI